MIDVTVKLAESELRKLQRMDALMQRINRGNVDPNELESYCRLRDEVTSFAIVSLQVAVQDCRRLVAVPEVAHG